MKKQLFKIISVLMAISIFGSALVFDSSAASSSQLQSQIAALEKQSKQIESQIKTLESQKADQASLKAALQSKISNTQQQIDLCNSEISKINSTIATNKAEINKKNQQIEADKLSFKKRIRAIYMSNQSSNVQVLLGADSFSDYLQLSQLTSSVSAHDKKMIEKIVTAIEALQEKQKENEKLLSEQVEVRATIKSKQDELQAESSKIQTIINGMSADVHELKSDNSDVEANIKKLQDQYKQQTQSFQSSGSNSNLILANSNFIWPVAGYYNLSAGFASNDSVHNGKHNGVDIAGSGISGKPVLAVADGQVTKAVGGCASPGNYSDGGGYGNHVQIDHGKLDGKVYNTIYAHMASITVSAGSYVKQGQVIGYVGTSGWSTGYHLHFGIMVNGSWVNPMGYYRRVS